MKTQDIILLRVFYQQLRNMQEQGINLEAKLKPSLNEQVGSNVLSLFRNGLT